jgi:hypothetical protein
MTAIDHLDAADRIVLAGLSAYEAAMARAWENAASELVAGYSAENVAVAAEGHQQRTLASRGRLHRELWTKALAHLASDGPQEAA